MSGIYIHIPFCSSKCIYCAFYSLVNQKDIDKYIDYLLREIVQKSNDDEKISTIYFGGGTPSLLSKNQISTIIDAVNANFNTNEVLEITFEANPEQLTFEYCRDLKNLGINRLSIGVQSFNDKVLKFLGRKHSSNDVLYAIENAKKSNFDNISVDLIYGINERNDEEWREELKILNRLNVNHFSAYALTLEENSILYKKVENQKHEPLDEEMAARQYDILTDFVDKSDFYQYEVSNFAKNGYESKHNSAYWFGIPYFGFGASAHSFIGKSRSWNPSNLNDYFTMLDRNELYQEIENLTDNDRFNEYVLLRLRTYQGINIEECSFLFGKDKSDYLIDYFIKKVDNEHYQYENNRIKLTKKGFWFADGLASGAFLTE